MECRMLSEEDISSQHPPQNMMCRMLSEENKSSQDSPRNVAKQLPSQNLYNTQLGHEVGICMSSRIFVCYSDSSPVAFTSLARSWTISDIGGLNSGCRCNTKDSDQTYDPFSKTLSKNEEFRCVLLKNCRLV
jgi:hypothetical protein